MQLQGFKSFVRKPLEVRVGDVLTVDAAMETGTVEEVIEVVASQPLLDTSSGVTGQVIDSNQIQQLPLGDGTAYMLTRLAPGLSDSSDLHFSRPMDNGNLAGIVANGAMGGNDFTLDGAPNRVSPNQTTPGNNFGVVGFSPPSDAIAEFRVQTNAFDAQSGQTAGASVNLALKSGDQRVPRELLVLQPRRQPVGDAAADGARGRRQADARLQPPHGDVHRPHPARPDLLHGVLRAPARRAARALDATRCPPCACARATCPSSRTLIYDPLTATGTNNQRTPFPGNRVPAGRIDPVAAAYAALYPEPNQPGLEDNYFTNMLRPYDYNAVLGRIDHNFDGSNKRVRVRLLEQAAGGSLQLGRGRRQRERRGRDQRLRGHARLRLPQQHRRDHRLHLHPLQQPGVRPPRGLDAVRRVP